MVYRGIRAAVGILLSWVGGASVVPAAAAVQSAGLPVTAVHSAESRAAAVHSARTPAEAVPGSARSWAYVQTREEGFELVSRGVASPITFRGVNLGAAAPGNFPGAFGLGKEDYRRFIRFVRDLHANAIRVYTVHPPDFYEALREENLADPTRPVWLFHGVWTELPPGNDFWDVEFNQEFEREIGRAMDAVHGNAEIAARFGHASGTYRADVSPWLAGWILGREWEPYAVRETEALHPGPRSYRGASFELEAGTAMEAWLARVCDSLVERERTRYGFARAVSFVNWPTLDVMRHPTEGEVGGLEAEHDEDAYSLDPTRIRPTRPVSLDTGFLGYFASAHVYPYYPDFMNLDPDYGAHRDRHGSCNYAAYLADLKAHTPGLPLLIAEYGVPTSRGIAHLQPQGLHHGGATEDEQGAQIVRMLEDIEEAGCAGSLLFALFDEWFKSNWLVARLECERERGPLSRNLLDAEEAYGLISFDPPPRIQVDGQIDDWGGIPPHATADGTSGRSTKRGRNDLLRALYVTSDESRLYLRLDTGPGALRGGARALGVAFDVLDPRRGDHRLPAPLDATWSRGAEFVLVIEPGSRREHARAELFADRSLNWSEHAVIWDGHALVPHQAPLRTVANEDGRYVPLLVRTNRARIARDGSRYPDRWIDAGRLHLGREHGTTAAPSPRAEWWLDRSRGVIEIALPWGLLNVGDPSALEVLDDRPETREIDCSRTSGIGLLAWATRTAGFRADSLGPASTGAPPGSAAESQFLAAGEFRQSIVREGVHIDSPDSISYRWNGWERPITVEHAKTSADSVRHAFEEREAREAQQERQLNAVRQFGASRTRPRVPGRRAVRGRRRVRAARAGSGSAPRLLRTP